MNVDKELLERADRFIDAHYKPRVSKEVLEDMAHFIEANYVPASTMDESTVSERRRRFPRRVPGTVRKYGIAFTAGIILAVAISTIVSIVTGTKERPELAREQPTQIIMDDALSLPMAGNSLGVIPQSPHPFVQEENEVKMLAGIYSGWSSLEKDTEGDKLAEAAMKLGIIARQTALCSGADSVTKAQLEEAIYDTVASIDDEYIRDKYRFYTALLAAYPVSPDAFWTFLREYFANHEQ
jgi:hypothetical protein